MGYKSVEIVQAYLLLTSYGLPVERFEQDRTVSFSLFFGGTVATRRRRKTHSLSFVSFSGCFLEWESGESFSNAL